MREVITFARHGYAPSGTLHQVQAGWAYGYPRGTAPLAYQFFGDEKDVEKPSAPKVTKTPAQPPVVSLTVPGKPVIKEQVAAEKDRKAAEAKASGVAQKVHAAIAAGKVPAATCSLITGLPGIVSETTGGCTGVFVTFGADGFSTVFSLPKNW